MSAAAWDTLYSSSFLRRLAKVLGAAFIDGVLEYTITISNRKQHLCLYYSAKDNEYKINMETSSCSLGGYPVSHNEISNARGIITPDSIENYLLRQFDFIPHAIKVTFPDNTTTTYSYINWDLDVDGDN